MAGRLEPERPALIARHALNAGVGSFYVDRWPAPRVLLVSINALHSLLGEPDALAGRSLPMATGLMYCAERFLPSLREQFATVNRMDRVVLIESDVVAAVEPTDATVRPLTAGDSGALAKMSRELQFISNTWGGPAGLAGSGYGWGAFIDGRLVSVAATFLLGNETEDLGVVTEPEYRGRGLAGVCTAFLHQDVRQRCRQATWTTTPDNLASIRVAEKLGFRHWADELLYVLRSDQ